jgi:pimeloyl-ACP methyl ester carboxylesterase
VYDGPTFGLVHGAWTRGSCWEPLVTELQRRSLPCVVADLPSDQIDAGVDDYAEHVVHSWEHVTGPLVLVGHSLGGLTVPVVASRRPVVLLVYLCALLPDPGRSLIDQRADTGPAMMTRAWREEYLPKQVKLADGRVEWPPELAREIFFHDCPAAEIRDALSSMRPQSGVPMRERTPLAAWPAIPAEYILCTGDRVVSPAWSRQVAPERLGVQPRELGGGHCPMLAQPSPLADELVGIAQAHDLLVPASPED